MDEEEMEELDEEEEIKKLRLIKLEKAEEEEDLKKTKKDIRFERFIAFPITELPSSLAYRVIDKFHTSSMELRHENRSIKATREKVHKMLGIIPIGTIKLEDM
ncbi:hypothetical protein Tco_0053667 [Tanacetum coccineum]